MFAELWLLWLVAFVVIEVSAALSHGPRPRTLSEHLWRWFAVKTPDHGGERRWLFRAFLVLLALHLGWGLFFSGS